MAFSVHLVHLADTTTAKRLDISTLNMAMQYNLNHASVDEHEFNSTFHIKSGT